jgi:hypothetical protein
MPRKRKASVARQANLQAARDSKRWKSTGVDSNLSGGDEEMSQMTSDNETVCL